MRPVPKLIPPPSVSVGKFRRGVTNGGPVSHGEQSMSTSFEGFGGVLPPPMTHIAGAQRPTPPANLSARVSLVALGMLGMAIIESVTGSYRNESFVSTSIGAIPIAAASGVNKVKVSHGWYITARNGQHRALLHPACYSWE